MSFLKRVSILADAVTKQAFKDFKEQTLKDNCLGRVDDVVISQLSLNDKHSAAYLKLTIEALALIKSLDARRYRRICRHLRYIVNMPLLSAGNFDRKLNICHVDFDQFFGDSDHDWSIRSYACLLIHEATHGVLEEKLILYTKDKRQRIEALCHLEEYRFALRLEPGWANTYVGPFRPELWKFYWEGTQQERLAALWKRFTKKLPSR